MADASLKRLGAQAARVRCGWSWEVSEVSSGLNWGHRVMSKKSCGGAVRGSVVTILGVAVKPRIGLSRVRGVVVG